MSKHEEAVATQAHAQTEVQHQRFAVSFDYPVVFTRHAFDPNSGVLREVIARREPNRRHRIFVVLDRGVVDAHPDLVSRVQRYVLAHGHSLELVSEPVIVPGGEAVKQTPGLIEDLQARMHALRIDRHACMVIVGGGAVLDAVGYAAATTHRGVRVVRLPTTVLAQDDAGIGVKNGVNAFGAKNFLGSFAPPFGVICDSAFLDTLSPRDKRAGMAEAVKVALIRDADLFTWLSEHTDDLVRFERKAVEHLVKRGAEIHLQQITQGGDPFELGSARPLDYGHWAAHKLETLTHHRLRHGEAVAIGMALDTRYSVEAGLLGADAGERVIRLLQDLGFTLWDDALALRDARGELAVLAGLEEFREHLGGELTITLLAGIGKSVDVHEMDRGLLLDALRWLETQSTARCA
ncbi:MAG TPA: 3-dehydroquinate synthase [Polyangiales bacterium]|nr:3-dehydroquinate synthase [Polyangiales bacterium]